MLSQRRMSTRAVHISSALLLLAASVLADASRGDLVSCSDAELVVYSLTFETFWTRQKFPKQYPEYRPPAHWSKLIGMTHDEEYVLFRIGETANRAIKAFAETGKTELFAPVNHTFDEFYSPSIKTGAGRAEVNFFADGNHTRVSFAAKIIPSPDWFVGVDSLVLCDNGNWIDAVTVEGSPIDAGTDSGFTFTAPNWETDPPEKITRITSKYPTHPANSFYYPLLKDLPTIATFRIKQKKLYHLVRTRESKPAQVVQDTTTTTERTTTPPSTTTTTVRPSPRRPTHPGNDVNVKIYKYKKSLKKRKMRKPRYNHVKCRMEEWSQWSRCNTTCGKGYARRTRKTAEPTKLGRKCPTVNEEKKCSDYTGCYSSYFKW